MLSRLLIVRLKAAENALRDGRLDDAYRLATAPDIREHRRGAAVLSALTEKFIERARDHFRADRFTEATMDLDRAEAGGVKKTEIAELRDHVRTVAAEQKRREQSRHQRINEARKRIEDGSLAGGQRILEEASKGDFDAERLRRAIDDRTDKAATIVKEAEGLIAQGQFATAAQRLRRVRSIDAHYEAAARVETRLCNQVIENARAAIVEGKISRASDELACLGTLGHTLPAKREIGDLLGIAQEAARCVRANRYAEARRHAMSLGRLIPEAKWVAAVVEQIRQVDDNIATLYAGPLGTVGGHYGGGAPGREVSPVRSPEAVGSPGRDFAQAEARGSLDDTVALPALTGSDGPLPDRLLLLVDGGGSYLVVRTPQASVGRVASTHPADVPIFSDVAERHANITRVDDDYFLFGAKDVQVGGQSTRHHLLRDGDRIVLGRKAKFTFRLPSRKSPTAVLDLSDTTKMPNDVRRVVLFHRHAIVGAHNNAHIRCRHAGTPVVLFERNGSLWLRLKNDGHVDTEPVMLPIGEPVEIAGVSLVLEPWQAGTTGGLKA